MTAKGSKSRRWVPKCVKKPAKKIQQFFLCGRKMKKSEEFITIEPLESADELLKVSGGGGQIDGETTFSPPLEPLALSDQFECVFRRYFQRRADQFAMVDVRSERSAFEFYPQLKMDGRRGTVPSLPSFYAAEGHRRYYAKRHKKHFSDIGTIEHRSLSAEGSVVNFGANGDGSSEMEETFGIRLHKRDHPKSIVCYF
ncbi:hypothetical protein niasHS_003959 [Heterodera schachtii]|uniref:Uncharacterized protein n=1 Tax=Heterodera schachtii TaxID=97005 RepID=A0ABD2K3P3_HETSC